MEKLLRWKHECRAAKREVFRKVKLWNRSLWSWLRLIILLSLVVAVISIYRSDDERSYPAQAIVALKYVLYEQYRESGPNFIEGLGDQRRLVDLALADLETKGKKLSGTDAKIVMKVQESLREARKILEQPAPTNKDAYHLVRVASATHLERACREIVKMERLDYKFSTSSWFPSPPTKQISAFYADLEQFDLAARKFILSGQLDFPLAESACVTSRFAAMSALLASPQLARTSSGKRLLEDFIVQLAAVQARTLEFSKQQEIQLTPEQKEAQRAECIFSSDVALAHFAKSQGRRLKVLRAILDQDLNRANKSLDLDEIQLASN